jgi:methylmalonyl-CoA mutase N-terminal domain/subunit
MEEKILEEMKRVQEMGGMINAVAKGYIQREVAKQAYEFEKGLQNKEVIKVGVNKYTEGDHPEVELHEYNEAWADEQIAGLKELKRERDGNAVSQMLKKLEQATRGGKNVMPALVECCKVYATVGEMTGVFQNIFGVWDEPSIF